MKKFTLAALTVLILATPALSAPPPRPMPGDLDASWGTGGIVTTPIGVSAIAAAVAVRGDETTVAGSTSDGFQGNIAVARYDRHGTLRILATVGIPGTHGDGASDIAYMGDKVVVAAFGDARWYVLRFTRGLGLDQSFGTGGIVKIDFQHSGGPSGLLVSGGKILVVGSFQGGTGANQIGLARLNGDGTFDKSFGTGGMTTADVIGSPAGVTLAGDRIVVGSSVGGSDSDFQLVAYTHRGAVDTRFGTDGKVVTDFGGYDAASAIDSRDGNRIVLVGSSDGDFAAAQYDGRGRPDLKFGTGGKTTLDVGKFDSAFDGAYQDDGSVVGVGVRDDSATWFGVGRWTKAGVPDPAFGGGDGSVFTPIGSNFDAIAYGMAFGPDHTIVAVGSADNGFALARYVGKKQ